MKRKLIVLMLILFIQVIIGILSVFLYKRGTFNTKEATKTYETIEESMQELNDTVSNIEDDVYVSLDNAEEAMPVDQR